MTSEPERTAAIASWFQGLFAQDPPVLVGGAAVELYTEGAYRTGDLDFVGRIPAQVASILEKEGFARHGRHWVHEVGQVFIEVPAQAFDRRVQVDAMQIDSWTVLLLSPEDVLVDRLVAWKFWRVPVEGINAYLIYNARGRAMDEERLVEAARMENIADALDSLQRFSSSHREPKEIEAWAKEIP